MFMKGKAFIILLATLIASCTGKAPEKQEEPLLDASRRELETALSERDQLLSLVKEITTSTEEIKRIEHVVTLDGNGPRENANRHYRVLNDIAGIRNALRTRREKLDELEHRLKESALYTDELQSIIDIMRSQIDRQANDLAGLGAYLTDACRHIDSLSCEVDSLHTTVDSVNGERDRAEAASERLEAELNTCYYVVASKTELKEHKIIETPFLRKSRLLRGEYDREFFTVSDKRGLASINLYCRKAKILTNHPAGSFRIDERNGGKVLLITDPAQFWSLSNYLVVEAD